MQNRKRLPLLLTALMLVFCIALTGCAGRRSVTAEDFPPPARPRASR